MVTSPSIKCLSITTPGLGFPSLTIVLNLSSTSVRYDSPYSSSTDGLPQCGQLTSKCSGYSSSGLECSHAHLLCIKALGSSEERFCPFIGPSLSSPLKLHNVFSKSTPHSSSKSPIELRLICLFSSKPGRKLGAGRT